MVEAKRSQTNYRAVFREFTASDLNRDYPVMPEPDDFAMHLQAISQDAMAMEGVTNVSLEGERVLIIETNGQDLQTIKSKLKPILQHHSGFMRLSDFIAA